MENTTTYYEDKIKNICFGTEIENKLLSKVSTFKTLEDFVEEVRKYDECFNSCYQCANDLEYGDDGFLTSHGTCDECVHSEEEVL